MVGDIPPGYRIIALLGNHRCTNLVNDTFALLYKKASCVPPPATATIVPLKIALFTRMLYNTT